MASVLNVLAESWNIIRKQPTVLIPYTVIAILMVVVIGAAAVVLLIPSLIGIAAAGSHASAASILQIILGPVVAAVGVAVVVGFFVGAILNGVYITLASQARAGKKIDVGAAFTATRKMYIRLLEVQLIVLVIEAIIGVILLSPIWIAVWGGALGGGSAAAYSAVIIIALVVLFFVSMFLFLPSVMVMLERKTAIDAVKKSYMIVRDNFWNVLKLYFALIVIGIAYSVITSVINVIPIVGQIVTFVIALVYATWNLMIPTLFYLEFIKGGRATPMRGARRRRR